MNFASDSEQISTNFYQFQQISIISNYYEKQKVILNFEILNYHFDFCRLRAIATSATARRLHSKASATARDLNG